MDEKNDNQYPLEAFRRGEREALTQVYRAHVDDVFMLVRRGFLLDGPTRIPGARSPEAVRDLVQEVFARAFTDKARQSYDGVRPYRPFLLRIAKNVLIDYVRRTHRSTEQQALQAVLASESHEQVGRGNPEQALEWQELMAIARVYLATLDSEHSDFVRHRFSEGASLLEVARRMMITRRRARTLEKRVLEGLRRCLDRLGVRCR